MKTWLLPAGCILAVAVFPHGSQVMAQAGGAAGTAAAVNAAIGAAHAAASIAAVRAAAAAQSAVRAAAAAASTHAVTAVTPAASAAAAGATSATAAGAVSGGMAGIVTNAVTPAVSSSTAAVTVPAVIGVGNSSAATVSAAQHADAITNVLAAAPFCDGVDCLQRPAPIRRIGLTASPDSPRTDTSPGDPRQPADTGISSGPVGMLLPPGIGEGLPPPYPPSYRGAGVMIEAIAPLPR